MTWFPDRDTKLCISLSRRPGNFGTRFHNFLYRELGLNFVYKGFGIQELRPAIEGIRALGIRGSAVSMPFKESCMEFLDELDPIAKAIGAVNTIVNTSGRLKGFNTDYAAIVKLLSDRRVPRDSRFALAGSGGMAKAVLHALNDLGFKTGTIYARNERNGQALAKAYGLGWRSPSVSDVLEPAPEFLMNTTPIGMTGAKEAAQLPFSELSIRNAEYIFDVVASPPETPFIRLARELRKATITGADVIVLQAVEQFVLYTGIRPDEELIRRAAQFALLT
ncbi:MAG TPA: shikimate 5-dehydrogenase [Bdellovibrionota bacterium]|nr:shikimate 5-dehydrogenase [Bdellovibrionota bacterium]